MQVRQVLFALGLILAGPLSAQEERPRIVVTGEGQAAAAPDMAMMRLGVEARGAAPGEAVAEMSARMEPVLAALAEAGIAAADIQTGQVSLRPIQSYRQDDGTEAPRIEGYVASNQVDVRIRELDRIGALLDGVVEVGANRLDWLAFGLQDPGATRDAALRDAVADARRKAELVAEAAGVTLGGIVSVVEQGGGFRPGPMMMAEASDRSAVPVAPGEVETDAAVSVTFALEP